MSTKTTDDIHKQLAEPFDPQDIEWRVGRAGFRGGKPSVMVLAYMSARAIMERLDEVFGTDGWEVTYREWQGNSAAICTLRCKIGDQWITKEDGSENSEFQAVKGGISGALKRAAVAWGIGRYLYRLDETFAEATTEKKKGWHYHKDKSGTAIYWNPPKLPAWAIPESARPAPVDLSKQRKILETAAESGNLPEVWRAFSDEIKSAFAEQPEDAKWKEELRKKYKL